MKQEGGAANFIKYNNAVPIILGILFFSTTATFAATPAVRDSVYSTETVVQSIDNTHLLAVDLEDYPFLMRITKVTEDDRFFYLSYDFDTIDISDGVWQDVTKQDTLRIAKGLIGTSNLETYAESELAQIRAAEILRLTKTQNEQEQIGQTQKTIATVHTGLVGGFFAPTEEVIPQYESKVAKDDPLRLKNPQPSETFDANAKPKPVPKPREENPDWCPDIEGIQTSSSACPSTGGGGETPQDQCPNMEGVQSDTQECAIEEAPPSEVPPVPDSPEEQSSIETPAPEESPGEEAPPVEEAPVE